LPRSAPDTHSRARVADRAAALMMTVRLDRRATTIRPAVQSGPNNCKTPKVGCHAHGFAWACEPV
jgi:hypothetical protein